MEKHVSWETSYTHYFTRIEATALQITHSHKHTQVKKKSKTNKKTTVKSRNENSVENCNVLELRKKIIEMQNKINHHLTTIKSIAQ